MSFLGIAFLAALPLAAAPLVLHFFDRRRDQVIPWGAMQFLVEASTRKTSARRIKQLLLLLLRVVAVAALILALARPLVPSWFLGEGGRGETVLLFDNSLSMQRVTGESNYLQEAMEIANEEIARLPANEKVTVLAAAPYPVWLTADSSNSAKHTAESAKDAIQQLLPSQSPSDLLSALFSAIQLETDPNQSSRRILVLTDGQNEDWRLDDHDGWDRLHQTLLQSPVEMDIQTIRVDQRCAPTKSGNLAVDRLTVDRFLVGVAQPFTVTAHIQNYDDTPVGGLNLFWKINGEEADEQVTNPIDGSASLQSTWTHSFSEPGTYHVNCRIDSSDNLPGDDSADLVLEVVEQVPIVIVEGNFGGAEMQRDGYFVEAALGWSSGSPLDAHSVYQPTVIAPAELSTIDLSQQRVVVVPNLRELDSDLIGRLGDFVADGGGLWLGIGPRTDNDAFNHAIYADGSGLSPLRIERMVSVDVSSLAEFEERESEPIRIDPFRAKHPATANLTDNNSLDLRDAVVDRYFQFADERMERTSTLLTLSNGDPIAVENRVGRGRVIVQSVPLRMQWSNLARTQAFVVMVRDWIDYLAQPRATAFNLKPGDPIAYRRSITPNRGEAAIDQQSTLPTALLTMPSGEDTELTADTIGDSFEFRSSRTRTPGLYRLTIGLEDSSLPFSVQRGSLESKPTLLTDANQQEIDRALSVAPDEITVASNSTSSNPLWPYLLLGLVILLAGELVLSGMLARERFGSFGIPEHSEIGSAGLGESSELSESQVPHLPTSSSRTAPELTPSEGPERV